MRKMIRGLRNAAFFLICYAPIPLMAGYLLLEDCIPLLIIQAALLPVTFLLSLIPGKVGGKRKKDAVMERAPRGGGDPNPDRNLRNEALPLPERRAFPLRAFACLLTSVGVFVTVFTMPLEIAQEMILLNRAAMAAIAATMLPLALKVVTLNDNNAGSVAAGMILYALAGAFAYFLRNETLEKWLLICGLGFVLMTAFTMNSNSMTRGASIRGGVRPPVGMRRKNQVMLIGIMAIGALILYFDRIRQAAVDALQWIGIKLWKLILLIFGGSSGETPVQGGSGGGGDDMNLAAMFGPAEASPFWQAMEKVAFVVAFIGAAALLVWLLAQFYKLFARLFRQLIAYMKKFTAAVGEEYKDEQESLFDWGETRKELGDGLRKRFERLVRREKKWEQMDVRERVRYIVRTLYQRSPEAGALGSLTVHEAFRTVKTGQAQPEELANLYDQARYGQAEPDMQAAERLRKEAKV